MKYTKEEICENLRIDISDVLNIYPYGSKIYGTHTEDSDDDFVIVYKKSLLPSGSFKDNAISSYDRKIQGTCYSRGGFIDAINTYQISALECIFLSSASWHNAIMSYKDDNIEYVKKNIFHALRILDFGLQIKEKGKIVNYSSMNDLKKTIFNSECKPKIWYDTFIEMSNKLKS